MGNSQDSAKNHEYATVDTAPAAAGYWTNPINIHSRSPHNNKVMFSVKAPGGTAGAMTITLQSRDRADASWTDYDTWTAVDRQIIDDSSLETMWRAGVKEGGHTSGTLTFGFNW